LEAASGAHVALQRLATLLRAKAGITDEPDPAELLKLEAEAEESEAAGDDEAESETVPD